jgi:thiol-disulfide isomerase/thioredoxin
MKRLLLLALGALAFISINLERRAPHAHAVFAQQARKAETSAAAEAPTVRELDLEGLKKLLQRGAGKDARPLLINFWATWCEPCKEEFPDLVRIEADYQKRGVEMVFVSLDDVLDIKTSVPQFLREMHAEKIPSYLLNVSDPEPAIKAVDAEWAGALPATFVFDAQGKQVFKHTGRIKPAELRVALDALLKN